MKLLAIGLSLKTIQAIVFYGTNVAAMTLVLSTQDQIWRSLALSPKPLPRPLCSTLQCKRCRNPR